MASAKEIAEWIDQVRQEVIQWRRHLHQNPELSFQEIETSAYVESLLRSFGLADIARPTKTSVVARLKGGEPGRTVAIRADMDALPIQEENGFEYRSQNPGVMHACGHDGHTAMLLGAAKVLARLQPQLKGEIRFIFQHGEEVFPGGASELVQAGVMEGVDCIIGAHLWAQLPAGQIGIAAGPFMAAPDTFHITIKGQGGHAASPHQAVDPIVIGAQLIVNFQQIVARNIDPIEQAVVSVTQFNGGTATNIIPESATLSGTVRTFNRDIRQSIPAMMERIVKGITEAHQAQYEFDYRFGYDPVINDERLTQQIARTAERLFGKQAITPMKPLMGGEDFSAYLRKAPGCFFFIGAGNAERGIIHPHHHPKFNVDESALQRGVQLFVHAARDLLDEGW